ncbi:PIN domain-containing protein [Moraxella equi]|uniref:PIN domain n=1 Tax=Moraxella equi TaxID=60442 RepID=A0A378QVE7_9GAMM|nr:type II toxin-antitoxin system VapC family toxin [Moraxella equi]OPH39482.1 hypothetical protein B5J93_03800 [Moraxella equi]STZ04422.1 PIN domain [Moraxella equi]
MVSLDTNVLVRFLVKDDENQYQTVLNFLMNLENKNAQAYIPLLVVLEVNWVLSFRYKITRIDIIEQLLELMENPVFCFESQTKLEQVLLSAKNNTYDLSDLLIACRCQSANNLPVMAFDKKASKHLNFELLE